MRILWVVNTIFPDVAGLIGVSPPIHGGWMYGLARRLAESGDVALAVATVYDGDFQQFNVDGVRYFLLPKKNKGPDDLDGWAKVLDQFFPDLVHIHGTEYPHGLGLLRAFPDLKYVVSIQGLVSIIARYFFSGLSRLEILKNTTLRDLMRFDTIFHMRKAFVRQGVIEREYLCKATAVIGRTEWDRTHAEIMSDGVGYYHCNESLRNEFYDSVGWGLKSCKRHSIFISQGTYPIKGLHQVLRAVALLKTKYPDVHLNIAGYDITSSSDLISVFKRTGYGKFILSLIKNLKLSDNVRFLGPLTALEMRKAYLSAHVFVCPSSIENSPNSLGEAQILGVPCIASYCGGIPSLVIENETALLYQFEEFEMLASKIASVFQSDELAECLSGNGKAEALRRHDRENNLSNLIFIYKRIVS